MVVKVNIENLKENCVEREFQVIVPDSVSVDDLYKTFQEESISVIDYDDCDWIIWARDHFDKEDQSIALDLDDAKLKRIQII